AYIASKADPFYTISGGLAGIISVGAGLDLYSPAMIILIAFIGAYTMPFVGAAVEKAGIDDAVGAFAVHGYCGVIGAMTVGVMATGYPQGDGIPLTGFFGQLVGTLVCTVILGFIPGYGVSFVLNKLGMLRVSPEEEMGGLDLSEYGLEGYPEYPILPEQNGHAPAPAIPAPQVSAGI
ncbi:MAG: ammonium transporter, partial [Cyanobacteria bacterium J06635_11]